MTTTRKVAIYSRVSTTNQAEEGYSIQGQIDSLTKYCEAMGWSIYKEYTDPGYSGGKIERPAMSQLIRDAQLNRFDTILVYKLDRLSRSVRDTLYLVKDVFTKNNVHFVSLQENIDTSSAMGNLFLTLLSAIAEFEREQIKERMALGKKGRAKSGKSMMWAKVAYGYTYHKDTGEMTINQAEALLVRTIYDEYLSGRSITKLRDYLNENNMITKKIPWSYRAIRQILDNPVYAGYVRYEGKLYDGNHDPIISRETYEKAQKEVERRQKETYERNHNPRPFQAKYILSGIATCGYCGAPLQITLGNKRKDGNRNIRYQCKNRFPRNTKGVTTYNDNKKCDSGFYEKADIEDFVFDRVSRLQEHPERINELSENTPEVDTSEIQAEINTLINKLSKLNDLYLLDRITLDELKEQSDGFASQKKTLENELDQIVKNTDQTFQEVHRLLSYDDIYKMDYDGQKFLVRSLIKKVYVTSEGIKISWRF